MRLELANKRVALIGRIHSRSRTSIEATLAEHGATLASNVDARVAIALVGSGPSRHKLDRAARYGCACVYGAQVVALLDQGFVEVGAPTGSARDAMGEARSLLGAGPSEAAWRGLVALVDGCEASSRDVLLDYLEPQLARWPHASEPIAAVWYDRSDGRGDTPRDAPRTGAPLRVMPKAWLLDLAGGRAHRKHALADAVALDPETMSSRTFHGLMSAPRPHVRALRVGAVRASRFYAALARTDAFPNLEVLVLDGALRSDVLSPLAKATSMPALRALDPGAGTAALEGAWGERVEEVSVRDPAHYRWLRENPGAVTRVVTRAPRRQVDPMKLARALQRAIDPFERAVFSGDASGWCGVTLGLLERRPPSGLAALDMSRCPELAPGACKRTRRLRAMHPEWRVVEATEPDNLE